MKRYFAFGVGILLVGVVSFIWSFGWYPVASVDGEFIYARDLATTVAQQRSLSKEFSRLAPEEKGALPSEEELRELALEGLIEARLVHNALEEEMGAEVLGELVQEELTALRENARLRERATRLFGGRFSSIEQYILIPQIKRDILASHLFVRGEDFNKWLEQQKEEADIVTF